MPRWIGILVYFATSALASDLELFETQVRPVLAKSCYGCHSGDKQFGNLRLDSRDRILQGGSNGPAAVAGKPDESLLIKAIRHEGRKMPMGGKLRPEEIAALEKWIEKGLPWPEEKSIKLAAGDPGYYEKLKSEHWAFQPVKKPITPNGAASNPIDRFIWAKLHGSQLKMAAPADRNVLARRAAYVLTGLPPGRGELKVFLDDTSPEAYEHYVDKLLSSPHFGERWARHWLDVVRFAETYGYEWNFEIHSAWRYRDYLIRAFNSDLPYDQFVREHIAGDLLPNPRKGDNGLTNESILATAFYRLGEMGHDNCNQFREIRTDVVDNQIDTLTKAFQGVTVSCARCHDHKIDPIPTEDYYALYGILNSSRSVTRTVDLAGPDEGTKTRLLNLKSQIRRTLASAWIRDVSATERHLAAAIAWENDTTDAAEIARGLEGSRINQFRKLLQRTDVDLSDPMYPIIQWMRKPVQAEWQKIAENYAEETTKRERFNSEKFGVFADFRTDMPAGWSGDGWGYRYGRAKNGDFAVATEGGDALTAIFPAGLFSNLLSDRLNAVIRSPILPKDKKFLSLEIAGEKFGAFRLVMDDCVIGEDHELLKNPRLHWVRTNGKADQPLPTYLEVSTKSDNPRLPERYEKFKGLSDEALVSPRSIWGITRVLLHDEEISPMSELGHLNRLVAGPAPRNPQELAGRFERAIQDAIHAWGENRATAEDVAWLDWLLRNEVIVNSRNMNPEIRELTDEYRRAEAQLRDPAVVYSLADVDRGKDFPILVGGQASAPGPPAPRHFLTLMPESLRKINPEHSGRRELAEAIASSENPLTARVMVNRLWHHVFGRGLVSTTDDFGRHGEPPTHPELLEYLASRFVEDGWSMKRLIRLMVLSETFRQSSQAVGNADSQNLLWHRYPVRRLEAEAVRDSILAVSGALNGEMYGPSVQSHRAEAKPYRRLFQGPLNGEGRRSIYLKVTRMEGPRFLEIFDFPPPMQTRGNRDVTNVPSQSLALLNDPFVLDQARVWAEKLITREQDAVDSRLNGMFETALSRPATPDELARMRALVQSLAQGNAVPPSDTMSSMRIWKSVAHTFFNMKEFLYLR